MQLLKPNNYADGEEFIFKNVRASKKIVKYNEGFILLSHLKFLTKTYHHGISRRNNA